MINSFEPYPLDLFLALIFAAFIIWTGYSIASLLRLKRRR